MTEPRTPQEWQDLLDKSGEYADWIERRDYLLGKMEYEGTFNYIYPDCAEYLHLEWLIDTQENIWSGK